MDAATPYDLVVARLDTLVWRLGRGDAVRPEEMARLAEAAAGLGPSLTDPQRRELAARVGRVCNALTEASAAIEGKLGALPGGRRALRGYANVVRAGR